MQPRLICTRFENPPAFVRMLPCAAVALLSACTASGQVANWAAPVSGSWLDAARWSPAQIPNGPSSNAVLGFATPYTVTIPGGASIELKALEINNPAAALVLAASKSASATMLTLGAPGITNHGSILLDGGMPGDKGAYLSFMHNAVVGGSGSLRLAGSRARIVLPSLVTFRHLSGHTIAGAGWVMNVQNEGTIIADQAGQVLEVTGENRGVYIATAGGMLHVQTTSSNPAFRGEYVVADGASLMQGTILYADINVYNGGTIQGSFVDCALAGDMTIGSPTVLNRIILNDAKMHVIGTLRLGEYDNQVLDGDGAIHLANPQSLLISDSFTPVVNSEHHKITGQGVIDARYTGEMLNLGIISANIPGAELRLNSVDNQGVCEAVNGGILNCYGLTSSGHTFGNKGLIVARGGSTAKAGYLIQEPASIIRADGGVLDQVVVHGGTMEAINGGVIRNGGAKDMSINGPIDIDDNFWFAGTVNLNSVVRVGTDGAGTMTIGNSGQVTNVNGTARVELLDRTGSQLRMQGSLIKTTALGPGIEVVGNGLVVSYASSPFTHRGLISPGFSESPVGEIEVRKIVLAPTSAIELDVESALHKDQVVASGTLQLDGTLRVRFIDGYTPAPCTELTLISTTSTLAKLSGSFDLIELPPVPLGRLSIRSSSSEVVLQYNPADYDGSGFVDGEDCAAFVADFEAGVDAADFNNSDFVDTDDFTDFVTAFEQGC